MTTAGAGPRPGALALVLLALPGGAATAGDMDFVTDTALCGLSMIERHDRGMSFDGQEFSEIEYYCVLSESIPRPDWTRDETHIRPGYCEEPGALFPTVFVLRTFRGEPGRLNVYQGQDGSPQTFFLCSD